MSKVTTVYDTLISTLATLFPTKDIIPDPYSLGDNKVSIMRDSYGLKFNGESFEEGEFKTLGKRYSFSVVFSRELLRMDSENTPIHTMTKAFLEDAHTLRLDLYEVDKLGIPNSVENVEVLEVSGIEDVFDDKSNFKSMECFFDVIVRENLTI